MREKIIKHSIADDQMDEEKHDEDLQEKISDVEKTEEHVEAPVEEKPAEEKPAEPVHKHKPELPKRLIDQPKKIGAPTRIMERLKRFIIECKRVLRVTKKPDKQEFITIVKISAMGMAIMGVIGFLIHFVKELLL